MATNNEKTAGLTITRPTATRQSSNQSFEVLSTIEDVDSAHCLTPIGTTHSEKSAIMVHSNGLTESKQQIIKTSSNTYPDLEAGLQQDVGTGCKMLSNKCGGGDDPWPSQRALKRQRKESKRSKACCACWGGLDKKQKLGIKVAGGLIAVIAIILMAVYITKAVGGGVWSKGTSNAPIKGS